MYKFWTKFQRNIFKFIKPHLLVQQEAPQSSIKMHDSASRAKFTVCIEGNIGCGKTTLLNHFSSFNNVEVLHEPVSKWTNLNGTNLMGLMYNNPERWSHLFQSYVQLTMMELHIRPCFKHTKIIERSLFSARHCFVENLYRSGRMSEPEYLVYCEWFNMIIQIMNSKVDLIVYLRTDPSILNARIMARNRSEEKCIPQEYLQSLHDLHDEWLLNSATKTSVPVLVLDANLPLPDMKALYLKHTQDILYGDSFPLPKTIVSPIKKNKKQQQQQQHIVRSQSAAAAN